LFSVIVVIPTIHFPNFFYSFVFFIHLAIKRWWCLRPCWIEFTVSDYCDLILIWIKSHPKHMHCLPSCPYINVTHSGMNQITATVCYVGQHVGSCDWLVTQNSRYWYHKIWNIFFLNSHILSHFMLKWSVYQHISLTTFVCYWCLLITSSFENVRLPPNIVQPCWDWQRNADIAWAVNQSNVDLLAGRSPYDYRLNMGPKPNAQ
jgi:hypothetical protein